MNFDKIDQVKILVVGDIMLDKYVVGNVKRISPEAPVPVVNVIEEYSTLGGCGNVVRNIVELGAKVDCLASVGHDINSGVIAQHLLQLGVGTLLVTGSERSTLKERIIAEHRAVQMLRIDREVTKDVDADLVIKKFESESKNDYSMVVVSDYAKGMITHKLMTYLKENVSAKIIIDPKPQHGVMYNNVFMITPNEQEWGSMVLSSAYVLDNVDYILKTMGPQGMALINRDGEEDLIKAEPVNVYNVSGAGDTVVAIMAVCLSMGFDPYTAAKFANHCAGYVVTQPGTSVVPKNKFMNMLGRYIQGDF